MFYLLLRHYHLVLLPIVSLISHYFLQYIFSIQTNRIHLFFSFFCFCKINIIFVVSIILIFNIITFFTSSTLVSANHNLRKLIRKHALESKLLGLLGHAEMDNEIRKTVKEITQDKDALERYKEAEFEFDEKELEKYVNSVIRETKKEHKY